MRLIPKIRTVALAGVLATGSAPGAERGSQVVAVVPGTANPWLAGMPAGSGTVWGDRAPENSPVAIAIVPGRVHALTFAVSGGAQHHAYNPPRLALPDGGIAITHSAENGLSGLTAPVSALVGVFLDDKPRRTPPEPILFGRLGWNFATLAPQLGQMFFIGSGAATVRDRAGRKRRELRRYIVPEGAKRLLLGTMDEYEWKNNGGWLRVVVEAEGGAASSDIFVVDSTISYPAQEEVAKPRPVQ